MANIIISRTVDLGRAGNTEFLSGSLFADENLAHTFAISATRNGAEVALSGAVTACFIRPDGGTVELNGTIEDGKACVTLAESCYVVTGRFKLTVFVSVDGAKTAVYCAAGNVVETTTNTIIDPGSVVPSVDDIIAEYGTMQQAVEDCNTAKNNANSAAATAITAAINVAGAIADPYNAMSAYPVGSYCTRSSKLYRCITAIPTGGETWTESHWTEVQTMEEVGDLKSAVGDLDELETADKSNLVAAINEAAQTGGGGGITKTDTGTELEINAIAGAPESLSVAFEWSQGDVTNISPENPVPITTAEDCTITVNGVDYEQDFTATIGAAGIGKGAWDAMTGNAVVTQKAVVVTADMVKSLAGHSSTKYAAVLNFGTPVYAADGGILACSHYRVANSDVNCIRYVNGTIYLYDDTFTNDLAAVKTYVAGLNMVVVFAIETPEQYSLTPKQIALTDGANTISTDTGTMTVTYQVDLQDYIDMTIGEVADVADTALETADGASDHADALQADVDTINENLYKYRTETGSNTGTGAAATSSNIHWGVFVDVDPLIEKCRSLTMTPACSNATAGTYTATRWKNASGNVLADGETLTVVETKTANKGESVTFDNVGIGEFISVAFSSGSTQRTTHNPDPGVARAYIGYVNPVTGAYTAFSGYLSGTFSIVLYKPIAVDSMTLYGKQITLIGDSITEKNGRANVNHGMWLERWTGCIIQNLGVGGTGFARNASSSTNYKNRINSIDANADIIGVAASFNDMTYTLGTPSDTASDNTICGYANEFFDTLLELYPTKRIVCYSEGPWYNYHPGVTASDNYMAAMKTICENKGVVWDDGLYRGCALRPWIQANCEVYYKGESGSYTDVVDNIHPNSAGQMIIARWLERLFEKVVD